MIADMIRLWWSDMVGSRVAHTMVGTVVVAISLFGAVLWFGEMIPGVTEAEAREYALYAAGIAAFFGGMFAGHLRNRYEPNAIERIESQIEAANSETQS